MYRDHDLLHSSKWEKLIEMDSEEIQKLHNEWVAESLKYEEKNQAAKLNREIAKKEVIDLFKKLGVPLYTARNETPAWITNNIFGAINRKYQTYSTNIPSIGLCEGYVHGVKIRVDRSPMYLMELYLYIKNIIDNVNKNRKEIDHKFRLYFLKATELKIDTANLSNPEIMDKVDDLLKEEFLSNIKEGDPYDLDDNHCECELWNFKSHRCSCGNRRIDWCVEGDFINGYFIRTEPY